MAGGGPVRVSAPIAMPGESRRSGCTTIAGALLDPHCGRPGEPKGAFSRRRLDRFLNRCQLWGNQEGSRCGPDSCRADEEIIQQSPISTGREIWARLRDTWRKTEQGPRSSHWWEDQGCRAARPMRFIALIAALMLATAASAQTTFRDANGRTVTTVTTDSNGQRTFRDAGGRITGTATTDSNGTTTFRDGSGRTTGTATSPRR